MALGGGTFVTQNKELPGAYINFISAASASATLSERGIATMPLDLDWGIDGEVFEVTNGDFQKNSLKIFGYDYTHDKLKGLRDLFLNTKTLYAYKLTSGGTKAANTYAEALYCGVRGNDLKITIQANADDDTLFDVKTVLDTAIVDEQTVAKYTIPAPAQMYQQMIVPQNIEQTRKFYATDDELIEDIGKAYQDVIKQFYSAGCRNLQLDDCTWGAIVGDAAKQRYQSLGVDIEEVKARLLKVNNLALEGRPEDMVITSHICRGNYHSTFFTSGPYDSVADYVFAQEHVDALLLEYDDARSGGFAPLAKVSPDKKVVLGLITTKKPELEDKDKVIARIHEAEKYIPLERLCLSPQCGFASCEIGNKITEEQQWAKLALVKEIAEEVWK